MHLLQFLLLSVMPAVALGLTCALLPEVPANLIPSGFGPGTFDYKASLGYYKCNEIALVQLVAGGPVIAMKFPYFYCENDKWRVDDTSRIPVTFSCVTSPAGFDRDCEISYIIPEGYVYIVPLLPEYSYCPDCGQSILEEDGTPFRSIECRRIWNEVEEEYERYIEVRLLDGTVVRKVPERFRYGIRVNCGAPPSCPIKNKLSDGSIVDTTLFACKEQYCPSGEYIRFANGDDVENIKCKGEGLEITGQDDGVIKYTGANLPTLTCVATCPIRNWLPTGALENKVIDAGKEQYCPDGQIVASSDGKPLKGIKCTRAALTVETEDGRAMSYPKPLTRATLKCVPGICKQVCVGPTTTTTTTTLAPTTTTTTVAPDVPPTANQLWNFNFYYNYLRILHAFCSDQTCINAIQANGIGYDMVQYWDVIGRAIREDAIAAVRAACPTGSANLRNLGFTRVGNHYEHNFSGSGLKQGWVSVVNGACGASVAVKRWKCRMSEGMRSLLALACAFVATHACIPMKPTTPGIPAVKQCTPYAKATAADCMGALAPPGVTCTEGVVADGMKMTCGGLNIILLETNAAMPTQKIIESSNEQFVCVNGVWNFADDSFTPTNPVDETVYTLPLYVACG